MLGPAHTQRDSRGAHKVTPFPIDTATYVHMKNGINDDDNEPTQPSLWKDSDSRHSMAFSQVEKEQFHMYFSIVKFTTLLFIVCS